MISFLKEIDKFAVFFQNAAFSLADAYDRFSKNKIIFLNSKAKENLKSRIQQNFTNNNILIGKNVIKLPKSWNGQSCCSGKLPKDDWKLGNLLLSLDSVVTILSPVLFEMNRRHSICFQIKYKCYWTDYKSDGLYGQ